MKGIFVTNVCAHKVAEQIRKMSLDNEIQLISYDLIEENIRYLKEGVTDFLISQSPELQGYRGVYSLYRQVVLNEPAKKRITMQLNIVTKENVDYLSEDML